MMINIIGFCASVMEAFWRKGIRYFLFLCCIVLYWANNLGAQNLLPNSSFELGLSGITSGSELQLIEGGAFHGELYGRWKAGRGTIYFSSMKFDEFGEDYVFSVFLKSPTSTRARVKIGLLGVRWGQKESEIISLSNHWKRYTFRTKLQPYKADRNYGRENIFLPYIVCKDEKAEIHVDALQLEHKELSPFEPKKTLEIGAITPRYGNIFFDRDPLEATICLQRGEGAEQIVRVFVETMDYQGIQIHKNDFQARVGQSIPLKRKYTIPSDQYGFFRTVVTAQTSTGEKATYRFDMARVRSPERSELGQRLGGIGLGVHASMALSGDPEIEAARWAIVSGSGARWTRLFFNLRRGGFSSGAYDWSWYDKQINLARRHHLQVLGVFSQTALRKHHEGFEFIIDNPEFLKFCISAMRRYPEIGVWEMLNEPFWHYPTIDSQPSAEQMRFVESYSRFQTSLYQEAKANFPQHVLLMNADMFFQEDDNFQFVKALQQKNNIFESCDGISHHLYPGSYPGLEYARFEKNRSLLQGLIKKYSAKRLPIWQTEMGVSSNDFFDDTNHLYGQYQMHMKKYVAGYGPELENAKSCIKYCILELAHGARGTFYFEVGNDYPYFNLFAMLKHRWEQPKIVFPAHSTLGAVLDRAVPDEAASQMLTRSISSKFLSRAAHFIGVGAPFPVVLVFRRADGLVIPFWSQKKDVVLRIKGVRQPRLMDFMGNLQPISNADQWIDLAASDTPAYLFVSNKDPQTLEASLVVH